MSARRLLLLGAPGAGKGTQAEVVSEEMGLPHISSGALFRENINNQTELGLRVKAILECGDLVPDANAVLKHPVQS